MRSEQVDRGIIVVMAMTTRKILDAVDACEVMIRSRPELEKVKAGRIEEKWLASGNSAYFDRAQHLLFMCGQIRELLGEGRREKVMRWLGFLQGVLWTDGYATLEELKRMNMPDPELA